MRRNRRYLAAIFVLVAALYAAPTTSYFVGYDDFFVAHRTVFEDIPKPAEMITTTHGLSAKYRPGSRVQDYVTYIVGNGQAFAFRARNIVAHLATATMLYFLGLFLFESASIALSAALLFGLHPLANQSVVAASWPVPTAAFLLLASLVLLIRASRSPHYGLWLAAACSCLLLSVFTYEAGIVVVGLWLLFLALTRPSTRFLIAALGSLGLSLLCFFGVRSMFVHFEPQHGSLTTISKNLILFLGALATAPADSILVHDWWGIPLPSEIDFQDLGSFLLPLLTGVLTVLGLAFLLWRRVSRSAQFPEAFPWIPLLVTAASIPLWLVPFLLFTPHASETYLYMPAASLSLLLAAILHHTLSKPVTLALVGILSLVFGVAVINRNRHVMEEARIAQTIVAGFPLEQWKQGSWKIRVAEAEPPLPRYGLYSYRGLSTIDTGDPTYPSTEWALHLATNNTNISARNIPPQEMQSSPCPSTELCFWVYADGRVLRTEGAVPAP